MSFRPEPDTSVADWWLGPATADGVFVASTHGPPGYAAYVRFRHHEEDDGEVPGGWVLRLVSDTLARHTSTPGDVVVAQWEGITDGPATVVTAWHEDVPPAERTPPPTEPSRTFLFSDEVMALPRADLRDEHGSLRRYLLLRGPVDRLGEWPRGGVPDPFGDPPELVCGAMWPEDRAWFYAWEVDDDHGATIACDEDLAAELLTDGRYAAWRVERGEPDPPDRLRRS